MKIWHWLFHRGTRWQPIGGWCDYCNHQRWRRIFDDIDNGRYGYETVHEITGEIKFY